MVIHILLLLATTGALLFFALLGLSGCFITCYDRRVRNDLAQPCRELCLCCCQPGYNSTVWIYFLLTIHHLLFLFRGYIMFIILGCFARWLILNLFLTFYFSFEAWVIYKIWVRTWPKFQTSPRNTIYIYIYRERERERGGGGGGGGEDYCTCDSYEVHFLVQKMPDQVHIPVQKILGQVPIPVQKNTRSKARTYGNYMVSPIPSI